MKHPVWFFVVFTVFLCLVDYPNYVKAQVERDEGLDVVPETCIYFRSGIPALTVIATGLEFVEVVAFDNSCLSDPDQDLEADLLDKSLVLLEDTPGIFRGLWGVSVSSVAGGQDDRIITIGLVFANPLSVTNATNASPIVVTVINHSLRSGDMIDIEGVVGNTAANGVWEVFDILGNSFSLRGLDTSASVGNGSYVSDGIIPIVYSGVAARTTKLANSPSSIAGNEPGGFALEIGDKVKLYIANIQGTKDVEFGVVVLAGRLINLD